MPSKKTNFPYSTISISHSFSFYRVHSVFPAKKFIDTQHVNVWFGNKKIATFVCLPTTRTILNNNTHFEQPCLRPFRKASVITFRAGWGFFFWVSWLNICSEWYQCIYASAKFLLNHGKKSVQHKPPPLVNSWWWYCV